MVKDTSWFSFKGLPDVKTGTTGPRLNLPIRMSKFTLVLLHLQALLDLVLSVSIHLVIFQSQLALNSLRSVVLCSGTHPKRSVGVT